MPGFTRALNSWTGRIEKKAVGEAVDRMSTEALASRATAYRNSLNIPFGQAEKVENSYISGLRSQAEESAANRYISESSVNRSNQYQRTSYIPVNERIPNGNSEYEDMLPSRSSRLSSSEVANLYGSAKNRELQEARNGYTRRVNSNVSSRFSDYTRREQEALAQIRARDYSNYVSNAERNSYTNGLRTQAESHRASLGNIGNEYASSSSQLYRDSIDPYSTRNLNRSAQSYRESFYPQDKKMPSFNISSNRGLEKSYSSTTSVNPQYEFNNLRQTNNKYSGNRQSYFSSDNPIRTRLMREHPERFMSEGKVRTARKFSDYNRGVLQDGIFNSTTKTLPINSSTKATPLARNNFKIKDPSDMKDFLRSRLTRARNVTNKREGKPLLDLPKKNNIFNSAINNFSHADAINIGGRALLSGAAGMAAGLGAGLLGNMVNPDIMETDPHFVRNAMLIGATSGALGAASGAASSITKSTNKNIKPWMQTAANMTKKVTDSKLTSTALGLAAFSGGVDTHFTSAINKVNSANSSY